MHSEAQDRQILETDLRKAIARGELQLQYQPVVNAQTEELSGFEALVRWHHPTRGVISPEPVRAARRGSRPDPVDRRMGAARPPASRPRNGPSISGSRSTSRRSSSSSRACPRPSSARSPTPSIQPRQLELEITEGVFLVESDIDRRHVRQAEVDRRPPRARRFRHRLFLARLSEEGAVRQDQDRPELRARRRQGRQPQRRHHPRHRHPRREPRHGHDRRGRRDP